MILKKCVRCGKRYNIKPSRFNKSKYCSKTCFYKSKRTGRSIIKCKRCKRAMSIRAFGLCDTCYNNYWRDKKRNKRKIECLICGLDFVEITEAHLKKFHNMSIKEYKTKFPNCKLSKEPIGIQHLKGRELRKHQSKAGKSVTYPTRLKAYQSYKKWEDNLPEKERYELRKNKGLATFKKHPNLFKETIKQWRLNHPNEYKKLQSMAGKRAAKELLKYLKKHPEIYSLAGKKSQAKHPARVSELMKKVHAEWKKRDPEGYSLHQSKAMLSVKRPTKPEKIMKGLLPSDFVFDKPFKFGVPDFRSVKRRIIIQVDGPRHYKTMGVAYGVDRLRKTQLKDKQQEEEWKKEGYKVYRFTVLDIAKKLKEVKTKLKAILK